MTAFGISPLGTELGPFGGSGLITVLGVLPLGNNSCVVVFDKAPHRLDDQSPLSGASSSNYSITAVDPTLNTDDGGTSVPAGEVVPQREPNIVTATIDLDDVAQVVLSTDIDLEPRVRYLVTIAETIKTDEGEIFAGPDTFEIRGRGTPRVPVGVEVYEEVYRDFDYGPIAGGTANNPLAAYRFDASSDLRLQSNQDSLRKRLLRRITSPKGSFVFLPSSYGTDLKLKTLIKANRLQSLANTVAEQARQEPDVLQAAASCSVRSTSQGATVEVRLQVLQNDRREKRILFEFPING